MHTHTTIPRRSRALIRALPVLAVLLSACGGAGPAGTVTRPAARAPIHPAVAHRPTAVAQRESVQARVDVASDTVLAEGKVHIAQGAPSDAEVKREIKALKKAGVVLPSGDSVESFARASSGGGSASGAETPVTNWNPRLKPIAGWIVPVLQWASEHGWKGTVTSGYRSFYEQAQLNAAGDFSAPAGSSNHETTAYPGGAVDVTEPSQLLAVLKGYPGPRKLIGGVLGPADPEHFSATGD